MIEEEKLISYLNRERDCIEINHHIGEQPIIVLAKVYADTYGKYTDFSNLPKKVSDTTKLYVYGHFVEFSDSEERFFCIAEVETSRYVNELYVYKNKNLLHILGLDDNDYHGDFYISPEILDKLETFEKDKTDVEEAVICIRDVLKER